MPTSMEIVKYLTLAQQQRDWFYVSLDDSKSINCSLKELNTEKMVLEGRIGKSSIFKDMCAGSVCNCYFGIKAKSICTERRKVHDCPDMFFFNFKTEVIKFSTLPIESGGKESDYILLTIDMRIPANIMLGQRRRNVRIRFLPNQLQEFSVWRLDSFLYYNKPLSFPLFQCNSQLSDDFIPENISAGGMKVRVKGHIGESLILGSPEPFILFLSLNGFQGNMPKGLTCGLNFCPSTE